MLPGGGKPGRFGYQYLVGRRAERSIASAATIAVSALKKKPIAGLVIPPAADGSSLPLPGEPAARGQYVSAQASACERPGPRSAGGRGEAGAEPIELGGEMLEFAALLVAELLAAVQSTLQVGRAVGIVVRDRGG